MATKSVNCTAFSVQSRKQTRKYRQPAKIPLSSGAYALIRPALTPGVDIPANATVTSATLKVVAASTFAATTTVEAHRITANWSSAVTWKSKPAQTATDAAPSVNANSKPSGQAVTLDVTTLVQQIVSGAIPNYGFQVYPSAGSGYIYGVSSANHPVLTVEYTIAPTAPTNLTPAGGAVSVAKPVVTFDKQDGMIALQVQIDAAADEVTPDFDSGEVSSSAGYYPTVLWAGLADGASTQMRARVKNAYGWGPWSSWLSFSRAVKPTVTITNPGATSSDGSPPFVWTVTGGGTPVAWEAQLYDAAGRKLADSGFTAGTDLDWDPPTGITTSGATGTAYVFVWDDVHRVATPGDPVYAVDSQTFTITLSDTVAPVEEMRVSQDGIRPWVNIRGTRSEIPDQVAVLRNGVEVLRFDGPDVFTGTYYEIVDYTCPMGAPATYSVRPVVDGEMADDGPTQTIIPSCVGVWLGDPDTGDEAVLWNVEAPQGRPEVSVEFRPVATDDDNPHVIRQRLARFPREGSVAGQLWTPELDDNAITAEANEATFEAFADNDAGTTYRLVLGWQNLEVIVGNIVPTELSGVPDEERGLGMAFDWWGV